VDLASARLADKCALLRFVGIDSPEQATTLRDCELQIERSQAKAPPPGEVLYADIVGIRCRNLETGEDVGVIRSVITAGNELLEILTPGEKTLLIPWVPEFIKNIDLKSRTLDISPIPGLLD
jgi:16S rRNA processing protein RimM